MQNSKDEMVETYDVIGLGFGPAGIALAVALEDVEEQRGGQSGLKALFIEQAPDSAWQPGMLLAGTDIQHHFLRDFATPRNPRSKFTFPNYLKEKGRLFAFGLLGGNPGRLEWADYIHWVANQVSRKALYLHSVLSIEAQPCENSDQISLARVTAKDLVEGSTKHFYARNLVVCTGRKPNVPPLYSSLVGPRVFHSHHYIPSIQHVSAENNPRFAVIGSGQNAIEVLLDLADRFPSSTLYSVNRNSGFRLYDLGHFSNQVYFPEEADYFFSLDKQGRRRLFEDVRLTNYSSVDQDVSRSLYWRVYEESIAGMNRIHVIKRSNVTEVAEQDGSFKLTLDDTYRHTKQELQADVIVLCTGYIEEQIPSFLEPMRQYLELDDDSDPIVSRDYQIITQDRFRVGLFLNGLTEQTHGISDATSFSMMALKAQRILDRLESNRQDQPAAAGGFKLKKGVS